MVNIRYYSSSDHSMINAWSQGYKEPYPPAEFLPETTFVLEKQGAPVFAGSLLLTNSPISYFEYFAGNPRYIESDRHLLSQMLFDRIVEEATLRGYKKLLFCSYRDKLKQRYEELGAVKTLNDV